MKKILCTLYCICISSLMSFANVPIYIWQGWDDQTCDSTLRRDFAFLQSQGVTGVCFNCSFDTTRIALAARIAHEYGLEYHAWIPCMLQGNKPNHWYAVNRNGVRSNVAPAYVPYYTALDPAQPEVRAWLTQQYAAVARIPEVDFVQLDYIRYVDVILARGLWDKYGLVMNEEYAPADYCYCADCVRAFYDKYGIDILKVKDPSKVRQWATFRQDIITSLVDTIANEVHRAGKRISADVFPGPKSYATWMVRQSWNDWQIDAAFPMNYNDFYLQPTRWVKRMVREEVRSVKGKFPVISGLFICKDWREKTSITDPEGWGLNPEELKDAVHYSMSQGATGICLFSASSMTAEHWQALQEAVSVYQ